MIDRVQQTLLAALSERLFSNTATFKPDEAVLAEAKKQAVYSLVAPNAGRHNIAQSVRVLNAHSELYALLSAHSIPCVMIKGWASAVYYPEPTLRQLGDVDFLIPMNRRERASAAMLENGYTLKNDTNPRHWEFTKDDIVHELHWRINGSPEGPIGNQVETYLQDIYTNARVVDTLAGSFAIPSDFHSGIITILHMARHMTRAGMGLRHLCDWAVFVDAIDDFAGTFKPCFSDLGIWRFACLMTAVCVRYLGLKDQNWIPEEAFSTELIEATLLDILGAGNFGHAGTGRFSARLLGNINKDGKIDSHGKLYNMFSSLTALSHRELPITGKYNILLPFGWIYVIMQYLMRVICGKRKLLNPARTISEAKTRERLYAEFQLFERE